jgi:hypothetical protein
MNSSGEPAVEVLTAEIRVLQVGSRPVTLSAARQLDSADGAVIEPFGRVRIDPKPAAGLLEVVGSANGILVRSSATARKVKCPGYSDPYPRSYVHEPPSVVCGQHRHTPPASPSSSHEWTEYSPSREIYEAWLALPLIVLAGLR